MDIDRITINRDCPRCSFSNPAFYRQARLRTPLICRGCHCTIQLDDHMNECRKARQSIKRAIDEFQDALSKLGNIKIRI